MTEPKVDTPVEVLGKMLYAQIQKLEERATQLGVTPEYAWKLVMSAGVSASVTYAKKVGMKLSELQRLISDAWARSN